MIKYLSNGWIVTNIDNVEDWEKAIEKNKRKAQIRKQNRKKNKKNKTKKK